MIYRESDKTCYFAILVYIDIEDGAMKDICTYNNIPQWRTN